MQDWFLKTRRLDVVAYWMQAPADLVEFYIEHMNLMYGSMAFGDPAIEPQGFTGLAGRYSEKEA